MHYFLDSFPFLLSLHSIKIHSITNLQETERIITVPDHASVQMIDWSPDGQLLAVTTSGGTVYTYVTKLPHMFAVSAPRLVMLSSLAEVSVYVYAPDKSKVLPFRLPLETEPTFLAIGPYTFAAGLDKHVWFYDLGKSLGDEPRPLSERDLPHDIASMKLNADYCAALCPPQLILQAIAADNPNCKDKLQACFPSALPTMPNDAVITCFALSQELLIFATDVCIPKFGTWGFALIACFSCRLATWSFTRWKSGIPAPSIGTVMASGSSSQMSREPKLFS